MGTHLRVDLATLERTAGGLSALRREFADAGEIAEEYAFAVGAPALVEALVEFAGNWKHHRERLLSAIDAVHAMAANSVATYHEVDDALARALIAPSETTPPATTSPDPAR